MPDLPTDKILNGPADKESNKSDLELKHESAMHLLELIVGIMGCCRQIDPFSGYLEEIAQEIGERRLEDNLARLGLTQTSELKDFSAVLAEIQPDIKKMPSSDFKEEFLERLQYYRELLRTLSPVESAPRPKRMLGGN